MVILLNLWNYETFEFWPFLSSLGLANSCLLVVFYVQFVLFLFSFIVRFIVRFIVFLGRQNGCVGKTIKSTLAIDLQQSTRKEIMTMGF